MMTPVVSAMWPRSLVGRTAAWAALLLALAAPVFWFLFGSAVDTISRQVVDTRLVEFGNQVRGHWASTVASGGDGQAEFVGGDVEWVWQVSLGDQISRRSNLLELTNTALPDGVVDPNSEFEPRDAETALGPMRLAERIIDSAETGRMRFIIGLPASRYEAYVTDHAASLKPLSLLATVTLSLSLLALLLLLILSIRRNLAGVATALRAHEAGETEVVEGKFPSEPQALVNQVNRLLRQNTLLVERTRKYVTKIAHDINHPLAVMRNALEAGSDTALMGRQLDRMSGLVDRYSNLARAIGPEGRSGARIDIAEVIQDVAEGFSLLYRPTKLVIEHDCAPELLCPFPRHDIEALFSNLVSNAHKYADARVLINAALEAGTLVLRVEDDGPGIPDEQRREALDWGRRLDEAPPGTGFGLAIVGDIVELYAGELRLARSELGGLSVEILLPLPGSAAT
ncbi:MAG: HAMP domain-containing histidine kinase [Rhodospirillaceae bacterium]|nr:HAMP domain-containing histidine kinase [Rhodospirillaceae bacterium]